MTNDKNQGDLPTHFIQSLKAIVLPATTRERMRAELSAYADLHSNDVVVSMPRRSALSLFMVRSRTVYAAALALVVVVTGGVQVTSAAEGAVPGDILYPIKVSLAEPLTLVLATSERKAEYAAQFASRRVDEAATLSAKGTLDEKTAEDLAVRFEKHVDTVTQEASELEAKGDIAFSLAIRTDLEQKIASRVDDIAPHAMNAASDTTLAATVEADAPAALSGRFAARVFEKSKQLATTREHLETVLAIDADKESDAPLSLAALRYAPSADDTDSTRLFTAKEPGSEAVMMMSTVAAPVATTTATSTASTTVEAEKVESRTRFFAPFLKR